MRDVSRAEGVGKTHAAPSLAPSDAPFVGVLSFTVLGGALRGPGAKAAADAAVREYEQRFRDRLVADAAAHVELQDHAEEAFLSIRITYRVRQGEDRMAVGRHFQEICRSRGIL